MNKKKLTRQKFRESVFNRDNHTCKFCNCKNDLDAHHIVDRSLMPNGGYVIENGITLCHEHHMEAEQYHISDGEDFVEGMHPFDLYTIIGSNYELAVKKSNLL